MMINTYEDALKAIGMKYDELEFPNVELAKPKNLIKNYTTPDSFAERAILDRQAAILFE